MRGFWRTLVTLLLTLTWTVVLVAQAPAGQEEFVPVAPGELGQEQLPATPLVFTAYAFVWLVLMTYVFLSWRRLGRLERDLADVTSRQQSRRP
jgi:CcmD family protein